MKPSVEAEIKAASVREHLTPGRWRTQPFFCCAIAITRTGELWKRASIIAPFFLHSESTIVPLRGGDPPFVPILASASDQPGVWSRCGRLRARATRPSLVSGTSTIFLMSELASPLACTAFFLSVGGLLGNFAHGVTDVPCPRPCAQVVKLAWITSLQIMLVRFFPWSHFAFTNYAVPLNFKRQWCFLCK